MNYLQFLTAYSQVWQTTQDQDGSAGDLDRLSMVLMNFQQRNGLHNECADDQLQALRQQYAAVLVRVEGSQRDISLLEFIEANNATDADQLQQSDIDDLLAAPIGGAVEIGVITVKRVEEYRADKEMYKGYEIQTSLRFASHSSYIFKDGELKGCTAGAMPAHLGNDSITKAKEKIDTWLKNS